MPQITSAAGRRSEPAEGSPNRGRPGGGGGGGEAVTIAVPVALAVGRRNEMRATLLRTIGPCHGKPSPGP